MRVLDRSAVTRLTFLGRRSTWRHDHVSQDCNVSLAENYFRLEVPYPDTSELRSLTLLANARRVERRHAFDLRRATVVTSLSRMSTRLE